MSAYINTFERSPLQAAVLDAADAGKISINSVLDAVAANLPFAADKKSLLNDKLLVTAGDRRNTDYLLLGLVSILVHFTVLESFDRLSLSQEVVEPVETPPRVMISLSRPQPKPQVIPKVVTAPPVQKVVPIKPNKAKPVEKVVEQVPVVEPVVSAPVAKAEPVVEEKVIPPSAGADYLHNPAPEYPELAMDRGWEGRVLMKVHVKPDGKPDEISVINSSGQRILDDAAVKTVNKWMFAPATKGGLPVAGWVTVPITFNLS